MVKWLGYPHSDNQWVVKRDMYAPKQLEEFYEKNSNAPGAELPIALVANSTRKDRRAAKRGDGGTGVGYAKFVHPISAGKHARVLARLCKAE